MKLVPHVRRLPRDLALFAKALAVEPVETLLYIPEQLNWWLTKPIPYEVREEWGPPFHEMLGVAWPCPELESSRQVWDTVLDELSAKGLSVGRMTYGEIYSDADCALASATWCAVRHLRPSNVVETGVARGVTSRMILEAMSKNGQGHLWSVDLPYLFGTGLQDQTAAAIPGGSHDRWTYIRGSSRRRLRPLISQVGHVEMFVHDSLHTVRNMRFEMETVWPALRTGGLMLIDDVDNSAFRDFVSEARPDVSMVYRSADSVWMFGVLRKLGSGQRATISEPNG